MKKIFSILFFLVHLSILSSAQDEKDSDSLSLTAVTTTDFMQIKGGGKMNWSTTYASRGWCLFHCGGPTIAENLSCCSLWEWLAQTFSGIFGGDGGGGGDPTSVTNSGTGSGGSGGGFFPFIFYPNPIIPSFPPSGGGGGGGYYPSNPPIVTPPPLNPIPYDSLGWSPSPPKKDCAGVKGGSAYLDSCGYCVGGTTGKTDCICPTDSTFTVTKDLLALISPTGVKSKMDSAATLINKYADTLDFHINTRLRLAHFLAQVMHECGGFTDMTEGYYYSAKTLLSKYPKHFDSTNVSTYANCACLFDKIYCCQNGNRDTASKDGSKYRGHGLIQLTWKSNYQKFTTYYQQKFNDYSVNFVTNPELLASNMKYAVIAALWFVHKEKNLNPRADADNVLTYSEGVNGKKKKGVPNGYADRVSKLAIAKKALCL